MLKIFGMRIITIKLFFAMSTLFAGGVFAAEVVGDPAAGEQKSTVCQACHGVDGNSSNPEWPKIAGQGQRYFISQLKAFKLGANGPRKSASAALMYSQAAALSEQDMADLAAYYSRQKLSAGVADDSLVKKGEAIYRGGNKDFGSAACIGCHGPSGKGNPAAGYPAVAGQHAVYTYKQLQAFHDETRSGDTNGMMRNMVRKMSNKEMQAVAEYMQGLY